MKKPGKLIIIYSVLVVTISLAIFFYLRANKLKNQLKTAQEESENSLQSEDIMRQMIAIDSLLIEEDYTGARKAYEMLLNGIKGNEFAEVIQLQIGKLQKIESSQKNQLTYDQENPEQTLLNKAQQIDSLSRQLLLSKDIQLDKIDSLRFALAKANMRMESLTVQLASKSKNDYLKFSNERGVEVYYVGEILDKNANGWGVALFSDGSRYEGEWKNNMRDGNGIFYWPDGEYYQGEFVLDKRQGEGKYYWPNGEMFAGKWQNDKRNGDGVFYGKDGKVVAKGIWKNNELVQKE